MVPVFLGQLVSILGFGAAGWPLVLAGPLLLTRSRRTGAWLLLAGMVLGSLSAMVAGLEAPRGAGMVHPHVDDPARPFTTQGALLVLDAMVFGAPRPDMEAEVLRRAGLSHVLAVSGLHVAIVLAMAMGVARAAHAVVARWRPTRRVVLENLLGTMAVLAFLGITKASPSVLRASLMALVWLLLRGRVGSPGLDSLALAGVLMLTVAPGMAHSPSFQLSFLATVGVLAGLRAGRGRAGRAIAASALAWLATAPLVLLLFGTVSGVGPVANVLVLPIFSLLVIPGAVVGHLVGAMGLDWPVLGLASLVSWLIGMLRDALLLLDPAAFSPWAGAAAALSLLLLSRGRAVGALGLVTYAVVAWPGRVDPPAVMLVAEPDRQAVAFVESREAVVVDAGPSSVVEALSSRGVRAIAELVVSHCHRDHYLQARRLVASFRVRRVVFRGSRGCGPLGISTRRRVEPRPLPSLTIRALDTTPAGWLDENGSSTVLLVRFFDMEVLLPGDLEGPGTARLPCRGEPVDLLVAPHHGSHGSVDPDLLRCFPPSMAIALGRSADGLTQARYALHSVPLRFVLSGTISIRPVRGAGLEPARHEDTGT